MNNDKDLTTYADNLTLNEIASNDMEMTRDAVKNANRYHFGKDKKKAFLFVRHCLDCTLRHCGIVMAPPSGRIEQKFYAMKMDRLMAEKQVRIETRNNYTGKDLWRCGIYVYKADVLVAFISDILTIERTELDRERLRIANQETGYSVITNSRTDNGQRIFTLH